MPDIRLNIKATNQTGAAIDGAIRNVEGMRAPITRVNSLLSGLGALMRGDIAGGLEQMSASIVGTFGKLASRIGLIGAAFAGGWAIGKMIRDFTGLGKVLDGLIVPAKAVSNSINDMTKAQTKGLAEGFRAVASQLREVDANAKAASASVAALNDKQKEADKLAEEQAITALRPGAADTPERAGQESKIRAEGAARRAAMDAETTKRQSEIERQALASTRTAREQNKKALEEYERTRKESVRLADLVRPDALNLGAGSGAEQELVTQLTRNKVATEQIAQTRAHLVELGKLELQQRTELTRTEEQITAAATASEKAKRDILDAEAAII
jgi:hypothetical protein